MMVRSRFFCGLPDEPRAVRTLFPKGLGLRILSRCVGSTTSSP
jgi:hypothetical protein